jgi:hypothetical protein
MEIEFKELMFSRPAVELDLLRTAAVNYHRNASSAIIMCRMYFPSMSMERASLFLQWLAKQPAIQGRSSDTHQRAG